MVSTVTSRVAGLNRRVVVNALDDVVVETVLARFEPGSIGQGVKIRTPRGDQFHPPPTVTGTLSATAF
jgi:hypothetical protein